MSLNCAEATIAICPHLADYAVGRAPEKDRIFLIENTLFEELCCWPVQCGLKAKSVVGAKCRGKPVMFPKQSPPHFLCGHTGSLSRYRSPASSLSRSSTTLSRCFLSGGRRQEAPQIMHYQDEGQSNLGIDARLPHFTGTIFPNQLRQLNRLAWVNVSPRTAGTNTPSKVYEQLASGIPLVATRIVSHTQVLDEEISFLADPEPAALAESLVLAIANEDERKKRVAAAQRRSHGALFTGPLCWQNARSSSTGFRNHVRYRWHCLFGRTARHLHLTSNGGDVSDHRPSRTR